MADLEKKENPAVEKGMDDHLQKKLKELDKEAIIHAGMCLGEGTGAVALFPLMDLSCAVYNSMSTFGDINVEQYEELK